jgi:YVTN family beta-propeller protein
MTTKRIALISIPAMAVALLLPRPAAAQLVYVTSEPARTITVIQASTNLVVATIATPNVPGPIAITPDALWAYVADVSPVATCADPANPTGSVTVVDLTKKSAVSAIPVGRCPNGIGITPDGTEVYVSNFGDNSVSVINTSTKAVSFTINSVMPPQFGAPNGLRVNADGKSVYVTSQGITSVIDTASKAVVATINAGGDNVALSPAGELWSSFGCCLTVDSRSPPFFNLGWCTAGPVVFTPNGGIAFLLDSECGGIYEFEVGNLGLVRRINPPPGAGPSKMATSPDSASLYAPQRPFRSRRR